jgi:hypothetical protein
VSSGGDLGDFGNDRLRHRAAPCAGAGGLARGGEQDDFALHDAGKVILDRRMNIGHVERHRQPARKGVKVAQVDFAVARHFQLPLEPVGELAHHDGDKDEQDEVDDFLRILDAEAVKRRIEEEGRGQQAADGGKDRRHDAPAGGGDHHRDQIDNRAVAKPNFNDEAVQKAGDDGDQAEGHADPGHFLAEAGEFQGFRHGLAGLRVVLPNRAQYTPRHPCLSCPAWLDSGRSRAAFRGFFGRRRGGRAVECTALEMRHTGNRIGGSNPSLSIEIVKLLLKQQLGAARLVHTGGTRDIGNGSTLEAPQQRRLLATTARS